MRKQFCKQAFFHGLFCRNKIHPGKRIQQIIRNTKPVFLAPFNRAENMQEGNHISKISLVIAYKQYISYWEVR